ncbi:MAG: hypothetical protein Q9M27_07525, partial [Mariprofundaceae bacterium]|nr:hypothetical protein [Mariprofundaceae bacterium]
MPDLIGELRSGYSHGLRPERPAILNRSMEYDMAAGWYNQPVITVDFLIQLQKADETSPDDLVAADTILFGTPVHMGSMA